MDKPVGKGKARGTSSDKMDPKGKKSSKSGKMESKTDKTKGTDENLQKAVAIGKNEIANQKGGKKPPKAKTGNRKGGPSC